ncbi:MAG: chemotaxis protein CheA, partial [Planctomycetota bacterium]
MSLDLTQFHEVYFEESFELIEVMEGSLLEFTPGGVVTEAVHDVFRAAHSIKGGAGTFGFEVIADFTHHVEALLDEIRTETRAITAESIEALLASVDCIRSMLEAQRAEEPFDTAAAAPVREQLEGILNAAPLYDPLPATGSGDARWEIEFRPHLDIMRTGNDPFRIISELASLGPLEVETILDDLPAFDDLDPEEMHLGWRLTMDAEIPREDIDDVFDWVIDECELTIQTTAAEAATPAAATELLVEENAQALAAENTRDIEIPTLPSAMRTPDPGRRRGPSRRGLTEAQSIRVGIDKVDELINLVGELVITQSMLQEIGENFDDGHLEPLRDKLALLSRNTREIQESVMRIRMLPISFAFNRFPRLVHDLSRKLDKSVDLQLQGEQTELDKTVMEKISDPLTHLVRNALDHGIESPEERRAAGKPETGTITMTAYHESGSIVIEISDDGRGIDEQKVLARARERQIVGVEESLSQEAIHDLIFDPGFSTADEVSDISGRGVGMDVVRKNISSIGGQIHLSSVRGEGSTVSIRLPLTLAILDGQTVRVGQEN